ncbi:MAG: radical SAM family heme chaperone HemW [Lachnospiraceae bacterium]
MKTKRELSLYLHIPFCVKKCIYCDFLSFASDESMRAQYVDAICKEINSYKIFGKEYQIKTIFVGGGTPSLLSEREIEKIFTALIDVFDFTEIEEVTIEANPGTLTKEKLSCYKKIGINRLSMGLQSTQDKELFMLSRIHTYRQFLEGYEEARRQGFKNINIDLMMGLPKQTKESYLNGVEKLMALGPEHISSYSLIVEEETPLYHREDLLNLLPDEDTEREMYDLTGQKLEENGYHRYEISNYAKQGFECKHNIVYWRQKEYLGIGLGASSYFQGARFKNEENFSSYLKKPYIPFENRTQYTILTTKDKMEEFMYLGLRMTKGISKTKFENTFHRKIEDVYGDIIKKYEKMQLLKEEKDDIFFTKKGLDVSNQVLWEFLF